MRPVRTACLSLIGVLVALLGVVVAPPAQACACGGFVAADGESVAASAEYAALAFDGETERVLLSLNTLTRARDAALLIPTPRPATAALAETSVFPELEQVTAPQHVVRYRWWPRLSRGDTAGAPGSAGGAPVSVLETRRLGDLEVTTLTATDSEALARWLDEHQYVMSDGLAEALTPYVTEGWFYTAIRLGTDAENLSGAMQPLDLTFATDRLVYPMRLSAAAPSSQFVRTYVFDQHRVRRTDATAARASAQLRFAGRVDPAALRSPSLVAMATQQPYLTAIDQFFADPSSQIVSDFTFGRASSDAGYRRTTYEVRTRTIVGVPAGPVLVVGGIVAANLVVGAVLWRRSVRMRA